MKIEYADKDQIPKLDLKATAVVAIYSSTRRFGKIPVNAGFVLEFDDVTLEDKFMKPGFNKMKALSHGQAHQLVKWVQGLAEKKVLFVADASINRSASIALVFAEYYGDEDTVRQVHNSWYVFLNNYVVKVMRKELGIERGTEVGKRLEDLYLKLGDKYNPWSEF